MPLNSPISIEIFSCATHFAEAPLNTRGPSVADVDAGQVAQLGQGGAHLGALQVRLEHRLGGHVDDDNGVDDGHGRHHGGHHGAEKGQA